MAAARKEAEFPNSSRRPRARLTSEDHHNHSGQTISLDKKLVALKSATIARQLQKNPNEDVWRLFQQLPADEESFELIARFCHGYDINLSVDNVVRVACLAEWLGMTDSHCPDNLLSKAVLFFQQHVMSSWSNSIKALKTADQRVFNQADELGLINFCVETLILKALEDPRLLGEPLISSSSNDDDSDEMPYRPNARRKLFDIDCKSEDLTTLPLTLYVPIIDAMIKRQVRQEYVAVNLCQYAKTWINTNQMNGHEREVIEGLVLLLPSIQTGLIPCTFLCEMLRFAIAFDASAECRNGLELRIGMQLDEASSKDLLIPWPCQGYASDAKYDTECLRRILQHFYSNYDLPEVGAMSSVSELIDELLSEMAADMDLKTATFVAVAEMSIAAAEGTNRSLDGVYKGVDVFLEKHRHLTESEKEELCSRVLDCSKLSGEALEHVALNGKLPVRVVVQALFVSNLKLREAIPKAELAEEEKEEEETAMMQTEMEKMGSKVMELERECLVMRREIEKGGGGGKTSVWRKMKRKFGCMTSMHDCDCILKKKKVHPRYTKL